MTRSITRIVSLLLAVSIASCTTVSVYAQEAYEKDEVVYVNLHHDGSVDAIYVVNSFDTASGGMITDRGRYSQVVNLTTTDPILQQGDRVSVQASGGKFYYEGVLEDTEIPWEISVDYAINGVPVAGDALAGRDGQLEIRIGIHQRDEVDAVWRDHYAVQASLSLDSEGCRNIVAADATIASVGDKKQLSYIVLPGKDKDFTITADVVDFELDGISFNMIPLALTIDDPDTAELKDQIYELQDGAVELDDGAFDLDDGAMQLDEGADELDDGVTRLQDGVDELNDGVAELRDGADELRDGAFDLFDGTGDIKKGTDQLGDGSDQLASGAATFAVGLATLSDQSAALREGSAQVEEGLTKLAGGVAGVDEGSMAALQGQAQSLQTGSQAYLDALNEAIASYERKVQYLAPLGYSGGSSGTLPDGGTAAQIQMLEQTIGVLRELRDNYIAINGGVALMTGAVAQQAEALPELAGGVRQLSAAYSQLNGGITAYTQGVDALHSGFEELTDGVYSLSDGIAELRDGAGELRDGARELYNGTNDLQDGVERLEDGSIELSDGALELRDGATELKDGTVELRDGTLELLDGTHELRDKTADMDQEVDDRIDEILDEYRSADFEAVSFVDPKNGHVGSVQFVMKTGEIHMEDEEEEVPVEQAPPSLWQRFLNLFSFLWERDS